MKQRSELEGREGALLERRKRLSLRTWSVLVSTWQTTACMQAVHQWNNHYEDHLAQQEWLRGRRRSG